MHAFGRAVCATLLVLLAVEIVKAQTPSPFPVGRLTGSIAARANPAHRYAVYLPSTFAPDRPQPILFVLDYRGRARVAADVFVDAAERHGWMIMSSSNSVSDETPLPTVKALQTMWADAHDLLPIDPKRIYVAGLSGTARTATWVASQVSGSIAGVIGAAAGFSPDAPPTARLPFAYFGTAGDVDYNYWEMRQLERRLGTLNVPHRIEFFAGPHAWMPAPLAAAAIEWFELRAMRDGTRAIDRARIDVWWQRDLRAVDAFDEAGEPLSAALRLQAIAGDYAGLRPPAELEAVASRFGRLNLNPLLQDDTRSRDQRASHHAARVSEAMQVIADAFPERARAPAEHALTTVAKLGIRDLLAVAAGPDRTRALDARRLLAELDVQTGFYLPVQAIAANEDARAAFYLEIKAAIAPPDPFASYLRAKIAARARDAGSAVAALRRALQLGFRSVDAVDADKAFELLRPNPEYQEIVAELRKYWDER
jgi:hypothetical protein